MRSRGSWPPWTSPLAQITLGDLQGYFSALEALAPASRPGPSMPPSPCSAFAQRIGYLNFNPCAAVNGTQDQEHPGRENFVGGPRFTPHGPRTQPPQPGLASAPLCRGARVSEVCGLKWRDVQEREEGAGQITVYGKGGKTRAVLLSAETWVELIALKGEASLTPRCSSPARARGTYTLPKLNV